MIPLVTLIAAFVAGYATRWLQDAIRRPARVKTPTVITLTPRPRRRSPKSTPR